MNLLSLINTSLAYVYGNTILFDHDLIKLNRFILGNNWRRIYINTPDDLHLILMISIKRVM
jgi:hypothetical protein